MNSEEYHLYDLIKGKVPEFLLLGMGMSRKIKRMA